MTDTERLCRMLMIIPTDRQLFASHLLERHGFRFCVEFGLLNCEQMAADLLCNNMSRWPKCQKTSSSKS